MSATAPLIRCICLLVLTSTLLLAGCDDAGLVPASSPSDASSPGVLGTEEREAPVTIDDRFAAIAAQVEGFGGAYFDAEGVLHVHHTAPDEAPLDEILALLEDQLGDLDALTADPRREMEGVRDVRLVEAAFNYLDLTEWYRHVEVVFDAEGVHTTDVDERANRIRVAGVDDVALLEASALLEEAGVPLEAVVFEEAPAPVPTATTLRDRIRPVEGGLQIAFDSNLCTYGFTAIRNGVRGFVIPTHCTAEPCVVTPTFYYQPTRVSGNYIGYEYANPACPRYSDSAFIRITSSVTSRLGSIARTTGWSYQTGAGSITIDSVRAHIEIDTKQTSISVGTYLDKMGRSTGWTYGQVESTCQTISTGIGCPLYCQDEVYAYVDGGDSGSPVFFWKGDTNGNGLDNANLVGLLWGGRTYASGKKTFLFSRINQIEADLGPLTTH